MAALTINQHFDAWKSGTLPAISATQKKATSGTASGGGPTVNAKTIDYAQPGSGAAGYGITKTNAVSKLDTLYQNYKVGGDSGGGNETIFNAVLAWGGGYEDRGGTGDQGTKLAEWGKTGKTTGLNAITALNSLDYAFREAGRQQQTKVGFFDTVVGKVLKIGAVAAAAYFAPAGFGAYAAAGTSGAITAAEGGSIGDIALAGASAYAGAKFSAYASEKWAGSLAGTGSSGGAASGGGFSYGADVTAGAAWKTPSSLSASSFAGSGIGIAGAAASPSVKSAAAATSPSAKIFNSFGSKAAGGGVSASVKTLGKALTLNNLATVATLGTVAASLFGAKAALDPKVSAAPTPVSAPKVLGFPDTDEVFKPSEPLAAAIDIRKQRKYTDTNLTWGTGLTGNVQVPTLFGAGSTAGAF